MPAKIETTIRNGVLIAATQEIIQGRLEEFAAANRRLKTLDVSVDLDNPDKPVVEIKARIGEQELVGNASAKNVVQAVDDAIGDLQDKLANRLQDRKDQSQEESSEERSEGILPVGRVVAAVFMAGMVGFFLLRLGFFDSVEGYEVSGKVTFDGKQVPHGQVVLIPQFDQGINGPPSRWADIVDGSYAADSLLGGSYTVTVTGHDGIPPADAPAPGKELFLPYEQTIDFPHEDTTLDIEVPLTK